jgi:hypothetical protein
MNANDNDIISIVPPNTFIDDNRTDVHMDERYMDTYYSRDDRIISKETSSTSLPNIIYRFKFTNEFMDELNKFSKIHQYDQRVDFKEAWNVWIEENKDIIQEETERLETLGYDGDIMDKMFKSARYYFRNKSTEKKQPKQRRVYITVSRELLQAMDSHIEQNIYNEDYIPKVGFVSFCKENEMILKETVSKILEQGVKDSKLIQDKMKKTYKNRYFMLTTNKTQILK